jgi:small ligand-binding sensory domain FIST
MHAATPNQAPAINRGSHPGLVFSGCSVILLVLSSRAHRATASRPLSLLARSIDLPGQLGIVLGLVELEHVQNVPRILGTRPPVKIILNAFKNASVGECEWF